MSSFLVEVFEEHRSTVRVEAADVGTARMMAMEKFHSTDNVFFDEDYRRTRVGDVYQEEDDE